jgi:methionyl-tRNA formyltransferase
MRVIFAGSPAFAVPTLERLLRTSHDIIGVITQPDRPAGRGLRLKPPPVKELAVRHDLPVHQPEKFNTRSFLDLVEEMEPDLILVVAYGKIFRRRSLAIPRLGCVNLHASLLPKYRGIAPVNRAMMAGEQETGVTTIFMDRGIDTGDMILSRPTAIGPDETAGEVLDRLSVLGAELVAESCDLIAGGEAPRLKQDESKASYAPKLAKQDGWIQWDRAPAEVHNLIRGVTPWPGALAVYGDTPVKILRSSMGEPGETSPGTVIGVDSGKGILVSCSGGSLWLGKLQAQGRRAVSGADFARGYRIKVGDRFGSKTKQDSEG